ncbi:hypothetical protein ANO14919_029500 [Xylariales sp. No.14919]|nr:hypothetical protein ANO14919_029500 [Xylariales sp. No.14919]
MEAEARAEMGSHDDVFKFFEKARVEWSTSEDARELKARLTDAVKQRKLVGVRNIVCFGLGGPECWVINKPNVQLTDDMKRKGYGNKSLIQHVAALFMADVITEASENQEKVQVYSQEPMYRSHDITALEAHGIHVLDARLHEGFIKVGGDTLVFVVGDGKPILRVLCETTRPAAIICALMRQHEDINGAHAILKLLDSEYEERVDWLPFSLPLFHPHPGGQGAVTELAKYGQKPLQGVTIRWLKPEFNS